MKNFVKKWENAKNDTERLILLKEMKGYIPDFTVNVDNDSVFVTFDAQDGDDDRVECEFDEFGYDLLEILFNFAGLKAEIV